MHAYSSGDKEWMLTAVFSMGWVHGFDDQIFVALKSDDPEIHFDAVKAAGNWGLTRPGLTSSNSWTTLTPQCTYCLPVGRQKSIHL
jgi:hypothetical protein